MKNTDLIQVPKEKNVFWQAYYKLYPGTKPSPKPDTNIDVIDVKILPPRGLALWKLMAASWVLRLGRFYKETDPLVWIIVTSGIAICVFTWSGTYLEVYDKPPSLFSSFMKGIKWGIEITILLEALVYIGWEFVRGCKWLTKWSESIKAKAREEAHEREHRGNASKND